MTDPRRRGAALAAVLLMLVALNVCAVLVTAGGTDDANLLALRVETARALYAADSAASVVLRLRAAGGTMPSEGSTLTLTHSSAVYQEVPQLSEEPATLEVLGRSGRAARRVRVELGEP
ncbi:MAG TPA: hypothetical protein VD971_10620 [Phycisphaerales bacterium]|nr:hypothetical protein [Phycisphaerales bacterium]